MGDDVKPTQNGEADPDQTGEQLQDNGLSAWEEAIEGVFETIGHAVGKNPWPFIAGSLMMTVFFCSGFAVLKSEARPDKQWVPAGSIALEHNEYVQKTWPSQQRWSFWTATCAASSLAPGEVCNVLQAKYIKRLEEKHQTILKLVVDGDKLVSDLDTQYPKYPEKYPRSWAKYNGLWSFNGNNQTEQHKCFKFGPFCAWESVLDLYNQNDSAIMALNDQTAVNSVNNWFAEVPKQYGCYDIDGKINGKKHRCVCEPGKCSPTECGAVDGIFVEDCQTCSCKNYTKAHAGLTRFPQRPTPTSIANIDKVAGGVTRNAAGNVTGAKALFGFYVLAKDETFFDADGKSAEPLAKKWEGDALCVMGVDVDLKDDVVCPKDDLLDFQPQFSRSLSDEFGAAIKGDIAAMSIAYMLMLVYLFVMLSRFDTVHSMIGMSFVAVLICGMSYGCCMGFCGYLHWMGADLFNNNLNSNIPFLLLGLGIDDAFVLSSEFFRACKLKPHTSTEERIAEALKHGGMSIFITSLTDALAFLIGSMTVLPALRWFCIFAGMGVIFCFLLQVFFFMPCLALNARRADANRYDCICCLTAPEEHDSEKPKGCCGACCVDMSPGKLGTFLEETFGPAVMSMPGMIATGVVFGGLFITSIVGVCLIYKDFKIEWFLPDDSYVKEFVDINDKYFKQGTPVTLYIRKMDMYTQQKQMDNLDQYLLSSPLIDNTQATNNWYREFHHYSAGANAAFVDSNGYYTSELQFWDKLHSWFTSFHGAMYRSSIKWQDAACNDQATWATCVKTDGIVASRMQATLALGPSALGTERYDYMTALRTEVAALVNGAFPYSFEFNWWEEVGVIGFELVRNLIVCGCVIFTVVCVMIPRPRIACWVVLCILMSVLDVVGMLYFWGVTICGISTIYILICVGLAVDYSAHIAHMFKASTGTAKERSLKALGRIGPCVLNAVVSTFLAVLVIGFSKSYIFRVFFKAFFLCVVIAGAHGLWLLPVLLSVFGGDNIVDADSLEMVETEKASDMEEDDDVGEDDE